MKDYINIQHPLDIQQDYTTSGQYGLCLTLLMDIKFRTYKNMDSLSYKQTYATE